MGRTKECRTIVGQMSTMFRDIVGMGLIHKGGSHLNSCVKWAFRPTMNLPPSLQLIRPTFSALLSLFTCHFRAGLVGRPEHKEDWLIIRAESYTTLN